MDLTGTPQAQDLPDSVAIMVVDIKGFSRHDDVQQNRLAPLMPQVLARACERAELHELWEQKLFEASRGDGYLIGFSPRLLPRVVNRYLDCLQAELRATNRSLDDGSSMRMRLSLHVGPAAPVLDPTYMDSPVGKAMNDTHRLVDAHALRVLLDRSDPRVTFLVAALSEPVMQTAVRGGYSTRFDTEFVATPVEIKAKEFIGTAYLRVPALSGDLLRFGLLGVQPDPETEEADPVAPRSEPGQSAGEALIASAGGRASHVGDVSDGSVVTGDVTGSIGVLGNVSGTGNTIAGGNLDQRNHVTHTGRYSYTAEGDMNFGTRSGRRIHGPEATR